MSALVMRALKVARERPALFAGTLRGYLLFKIHGFLVRLLLSPKSGYHLGENVRVQHIATLLAEQPSAKIEIGDDSIVYENAKIQAYGNGVISIGSSTIIGDVRIYSRDSIRIGSRVLTSWNVFIQDFDPHPICPDLRALQVSNMCAQFKPSSRKNINPVALDWTFHAAPIEIGDDVWIGANVTILKGARIGRGCVVAAGTVVTAGHWPEKSIIAGSPARVVKEIGVAPRLQVVTPGVRAM